MDKQGNPFNHRIVALYRYIKALEQGDSEAVMLVLSEAEQDQVLEQMILEMNTVYQEIDQTAPSAQEATQAYQQWLAPLMDTSLSCPAPQNGIYTPYTRPLPINVPYQQIEDKLNTMEKQTAVSTHDEPTSRGSSLRHPAPWQRLSRIINTLAAVLIACALIGGTLLLLVSRHQPGSGLATPNTQKQSTSAIPHTLVVVATSDGIVYGVRPDNGQQLWKFTAPKLQEGPGSGNVVLVQGQVVYALLNSQIYALHASDGMLIWHQNLFLPNSQQDSYDTLLFDQNMLYVSGIVFDNNIPSGHLDALHASDGTIAWTYTGYDSPLLATHNGIVYVTKGDETLTGSIVQALHGADGTLIWTKHIPEPISATADDAGIYIYLAHDLTSDPNGFHKEDKTIIALNAQDGTQRWSTPIMADDAKVLIMDQNLLFLRETNQLCAYQASNGHLTWCVPLEADLLHFTSYIATSHTLSILTSNVFSKNTSSLASYDEGNGQQPGGAVTLDNSPTQWAQFGSVPAPNAQNLVSGNGLIFVSTAFDVWAINQSEHIVWKYPNPEHAQNAGSNRSSFEAITFGLVG